jgi:hypothetical protein
MLIWVLRGDGVLAAVTAFLLLARLATQRLLLPRGAYVLGAAIGFCGWLAFLFSRGVVSEQPGTGPFIWQQLLIVAPFTLPLQAGLLGWVGVRSSWRWCFLAAGLLLVVIPVFLLPLLSGR